MDIQTFPVVRQEERTTNRKTLQVAASIDELIRRTRPSGVTKQAWTEHLLLSSPDLQQAIAR